ncbi:hypothetical protein [Paraburkholderia tagetis]|uniref:Uncharacterized protein n=1 Tax=Paraburkholderia tagetis TaxID=2913261 RepID=A0A9X1RPF9_9BURK|nr:hypothetical protein [Paraburkholderia tagetis]MCG5075148.1 hypothetical protein [Paraburkholderia tagetis]
MNRLLTLLAIVSSALLAQPTFAQAIDDSNCLRHLGGGGFGDFECYERHTKMLIPDSTKVADSIKNSSHVNRETKLGILKYMKIQKNSSESCDLAINLAYPSKKERADRNHIEVYDVMAARCRYGLRKQQNEFLHDLSSIVDD